MRKQLAIAASIAIVSVVALAAVAISAIAPHARDAQSAVVAAEKLPAVEEATIRDSRRGAPTEPAADAPITAHAKTFVGGEVWKIVSYRSRSGMLCAGVTWPGEGQAMGCATRARLFARGPVSVEVGSRQAPGQFLTWQNIVVNGIADVDVVERIELTSTDCSTRDIAMDSNGFFLDVTTTGSIASGVWPYQIHAFNANGELVQSIRVEPDAPDTELARVEGLHAPAPRPQCA
jgi:hypothetical protein